MGRLFQAWIFGTGLRPFATAALLVSWQLTAAAAWGQAGGAEANPAAAPAKVEPPDTFFSILFSGGPVGVIIMLVLIGLSLTAAYLVFEQFMAIRRTVLMPEGLGEKLRDLVHAGRLAEADAACRETPCFLSFIVHHAMAEFETGWNAVEKALEDATAEQAARLYRRVEYLSVIANIAPMVGLLGTVTGMIIAFRQVAITQGSAGAGELAEGIYQALVTTVAGLVIAIPSLGVFAVLRNRVDELVAEAAYLAQHAVSPFKTRRVVKPKPSPTPPPPPPAP